MEYNGKTYNSYYAFQKDTDLPVAECSAIWMEWKLKRVNEKETNKNTTDEKSGHSV